MTSDYMIVGRFPKDQLLREIVGVVCSLLETRTIEMAHTNPDCLAPDGPTYENGPDMVAKYFGEACTCAEIEVSLSAPRYDVGGWTCTQAKAWLP